MPSPWISLISTENVKPKFRVSFVQTKKILDSAWTINDDGFFAVHQRHRLQKPRQTQHMVSVKVGEENFEFFVEAYFCLHHLPLCVFAAVKHPLFLWALYNDGWQAPLQGWHAPLVPKNTTRILICFCTFSNTAISLVNVLCT